MFQDLESRCDVMRSLGVDPKKQQGRVTAQAALKKLVDWEPVKFMM